MLLHESQVSEQTVTLTKYRDLASMLATTSLDEPDRFLTVLASLECYYRIKASREVLRQIPYIPVWTDTLYGLAYLPSSC